MCVCVFEGKTKIGRQTETDHYRQRQTKTDRDRQTKADRDRQTDTDRQRHRQTHRERLCVQLCAICDAGPSKKHMCVVLDLNSNGHLTLPSNFPKPFSFVQRECPDRSCH